MADASNGGIQIIYDGECPFCSSYIGLVRLRDAVGHVELIDARQPHPLVAEVRARGLDLDEGMVAVYNGAFHHGHACVHLLATLTEDTGLANGVFRRLFASKTRTKGLYPLMRGARNLALRLLGRSKIG